MNAKLCIKLTCYPCCCRDTEYGPEMDGKGANSNNVKYEDVEKQPAETPENHLLTSEDVSVAH